MPKNSLKQIEQDEKKILEELSKNANKSVNEIAQSLGFSRQKVWRVIKNLEKNQIIWGYVAVKDAEKLGKKSFLILMKRTNKPITKEILEKMVIKNLTKRIEKLGIESLTQKYLNGVYDWLIYFNADDIRTAKIFVEELSRTYKGHIREIILQEVMFVAQNFGITNPNIEDIKDFF